MKIFPECGGLTASRDHIKLLTTELNKQRKNDDEDHCDITLTCDGSRFPAHKAILRAASPYFDCLLGGQFAEREQKEIDLTESISDPETLETILEFIYTGNLLIEGSNFRELLSASSLFLLNEATKLLSEYLINSLIITNCLEIFELAFKYCLEEISKLCYGIIKSRMHDYFCHGSKMLNVPVEIFVHLCKRDVFIYTSKQDTNNTIKEYVTNTKALYSNISQETISNLYEIVESHGITDMDHILVFDGWMDINKEHGVKPVQDKDDDAKRNEEQSREILIMKCLEDIENKNDVNIIGWLGTDFKWIKVASVNLASLGVDTLGRFVGFANDSMVFEFRSNQEASATPEQNILFIPLNDREPRKVTSACKACFEGSIEYDEACNHLYFTAWNELFCVVPIVDLNLEDGSWDEYGNFTGYGKKTVVGYVISKKSPQNNDKWEQACTLVVPDDYYDHDELSDHVISPISFQVCIDGNRALLVMDNDDENYLTVTELTPDDSGKLKAKMRFHENIEIDGFVSCTLTKATDAKLFFQSISAGSKTLSDKSSTFCIESIAELNLLNKKVAELKVCEDNCFPVSEYNEYNELVPFQGLECYRQLEVRIWKYGERDFRRFATSKQSGILHLVEKVVPYVTEMWSFDPSKNEWRSLPGPPCEFMFDSIYIREVPATIQLILADNPTKKLCNF